MSEQFLTQITHGLPFHIYGKIVRLHLCALGPTREILSVELRKCI